jgi:beta-glucanase (GH16 family)
MLSIPHREKGGVLPFFFMYRDSATQAQLNALLARAFAVVGVSCLVAATSLILAATGNPLSKLSWIKNSPAPHATPTAKNNRYATATQACGTQSVPGVLFASCPSFTANFATQHDGLLGSRFFNIYSGEPEANGEAQLYTADQKNVRVENGNLVLQALNDPQRGYKYTSGRIDTKGKEDFMYGKLVVRATIPSGIGTWPAIWMLPSQSKYAAMSPANDPDAYLNDGEIDMAESVGTEPHVVYGIAHSRAYPEDGPDRSYYSTARLLNNDTTFHDYEVDWTPTNLTFKVDGKAFFAINKKPGADYRSWPYDQQFYLVVNLALGGSWGGVDRKDFPLDGVNPAALPSALRVQSVKYYPYIGK